MTGCIGAEPLRIGHDTYPAKVEAVGIPAGGDGDVGVGGFVGVSRAGIGEAIEVPGRTREEAVVERVREFCRPMAVLGIAVFVPAAAVVQEGEQFDHLPVGAGTTPASSAP